MCSIGFISGDKRRAIYPRRRVYPSFFYEHTSRGSRAGSLPYGYREHVTLVATLSVRQLCRAMMESLKIDALFKCLPCNSPWNFFSNFLDVNRAREQSSDISKHAARESFAVIPLTRVNAERSEREDRFRRRFLPIDSNETPLAGFVEDGPRGLDKQSRQRYTTVAASGMREEPGKHATITGSYRCCFQFYAFFYNIQSCFPLYLPFRFHKDKCRSTHFRFSISISR